MATGFFAAGLFTYVMRDRIQVCYTLKSDAATYTQVYWMDDKGFNEQESIRKPVAKKQRWNVCLSDNLTIKHGGMRVDPVDRAGKFLLEDVKVKWLGSLFSAVTDVAMSDRSLLSRHDVIPSGDGYLATSSDPYFVWRFDARTALKLYAVNLTVVVLATGTILLLCGPGRAGSTLEAHHYLLAGGLFTFYPVFLVVAWLVEDPEKLMDASRYALFWSLVLVTLYLWGAGRGLVRKKAVPYLVGASLLFMIVGFDVWYRVGWTDRQLFVKVSHDVYNWRLDRGLSENRNGSSIRYYEDFERIGDLIVPGSYFISDKATGYYVAAALPLYPRIAHRHHKLVPSEYWKLLEALCAVDGDPDVDRALQNVLTLEGAETPVYLIVILDPENRNLANSCMYNRYPLVKDRLTGISKPVYDGEYLKVFDLGAGTGDLNK